MGSTVAPAGMAQWLQIGCLCVIYQQQSVHLAETCRSKTRNQCSSKTPHLLICNFHNVLFYCSPTFKCPQWEVAWTLWSLDRPAFHYYTALQGSLNLNQSRMHTWTSCSSKMKQRQNSASILFYKPPNTFVKFEITDHAGEEIRCNLHSEMFLQRFIVITLL